MTKANKQRIKAWISALRSGKYQQARNTLRDGDVKDKAFCCLGVACDLYRAKTKHGKWKYCENDGEWHFVLPGGERDGSVLPPTVAKWLGVQNNPIVARFGGRPLSLSSLNDGVPYGVGGPYSFRQIADVIEEHLLGPNAGAEREYTRPKVKA